MRLDFNCKANSGMTSARRVAAHALFIPHVFFELESLGTVDDSRMNALPRVVCYMSCPAVSRFKGCPYCP